MPFKIITTVVHEGLPDMGEELIVHTTGGNRVCTVSRGRLGEKQFMIRTKDWPKPVRDAAVEVVRELRRKGKDVDQGDVVAWIDLRRSLIVGNRIHVFLVCAEHSRKPITLKGIITGFTIP